MKDLQARHNIHKLLSSLPEDEIKRLGSRIELDRLQKNYNLPHSTVIDMMRPYLAAVRAPRTLTPLRLFCIPFEDLLCVPTTKDIKPGTIPRSAIQPVWNWVTQDLIADEFSEINARFLEAQKERDAATIQAVAATLWELCGPKMADILGSIHTDKKREEKLRDLLGGEHHIKAATDISHAFMIAKYSESLKAILPAKPFNKLLPDHITSITQCYKDIAEEAPGSETYLFLIIMARMVQPFPILKVLRSLTGSRSDSVIRNTDLALAGNIIIDALEKDAQLTVESAKSDQDSEEAIIRRASRFTTAYKSITRDIGIKRDGDWGKRLSKSCSLVRKAVDEKVIKKAPNVVKLAFSTRKGLIHKLDGFPDPGAFAAAEKRAKALVETQHISEQLGLRTACSNAILELQQDFDKLNEQIIAKLKMIKPKDYDAAIANLNMAVRLTELICTSDEANRLRKRGMEIIKTTLGASHVSA